MARRETYRWMQYHRVSWRRDLQLPCHDTEILLIILSRVLSLSKRLYTIRFDAISFFPPCNIDRSSSLCFRNSVSDLQSHLSTLELRVARETRRRLSLEDEVRRLRDENRRLQDESHAAAQQLRRFTEWFFHTIDHQ